MLKKTVTYIDYDGNERTEDFYFDLSEDELIEMAVSEKGGLDNYIQTIIQTKDQKEIVKTFKELVAKAYGKKTADGRNFYKNSEILEDFVSTRAYTKIFMELAFNSDAAAQFINKVVPPDVLAEVAKLRDKAEVTSPVGSVTNPGMQGVSTAPTT